MMQTDASFKVTDFYVKGFFQSIIDKIYTLFPELDSSAILLN